jgi:transposase-like protein
VTDLPTKICAKCQQTLPLTSFAGRQRTCVACVQAQRAKTAERKDAVAWSPELAERIVDALSAGMTVAEVTAQAAMPAPRQLRAWRRANSEFDAACAQAEQASAAAHIDAAKQVVRQMEEGKIPASDGNHIFNAHMKLAATLHPKRYGANPTIDITSAGKPIVDLGAVLEAAFAALPALPKPIDVEAEEVPLDRTLQ